MNATRIAKALGERAEEVCRAYLPHGRRQGRYWTAGDIRGARGRSLFVRLAPPGVPGNWTDAAEGTYGDLLDLIRHRMGGVPLRVAMAEARAFLALPAAPASGSADTYDSSEAARRLWQRCRAIDGTLAEAYLRARAIHRCRFSALRFHPALFYRDGGGVRRLPALVAAVTANTEERSGPGEHPDHPAIVGVHRTWLDPRHPAKAAVSFPRKTLGRVHGHAVRFGDTDRRNAFEKMRDLAADAYRAETGDTWRPRHGSHTSRTGTLTSAAIDARDFRRARKDRETRAHLPDGTLVAITGGKTVTDAGAIWATLDRTRAKYANMVLVHGGGPGVEKIAASWAEARGVDQIVCRPDWNAHGKAAPFRRNDDLLNLLPKGVIAFPGSGITGNMIDKAKRLGIPVMIMSV